MSTGGKHFRNGSGAPWQEFFPVGGSPIPGLSIPNLIWAATSNDSCCSGWIGNVELYLIYTEIHYESCCLAANRGRSVPPPLIAL